MKKCQRRACENRGELLPFSSFSKNTKRKDGLQQACKKCHHQEYLKHRTRILERSKINQKNNPNRSAIVRKNSLKKKYGISINEYNDMFASQSGCCFICKLHISELPKPLLCIDHDHISNKIRGLLCHACNLLLGNAKDDLKILFAAIDYLNYFNNKTDCKIIFKRMDN